MDRSSAEIETQLVETRIAETEMVDSQTVETEMVDLSDISLDELRTNVVEPLQPYLMRVLSSIAKPRVNLGSTGPPGRDD